MSSNPHASIPTISIPNGDDDIIAEDVKVDVNAIVMAEKTRLNDGDDDDIFELGAENYRDSSQNNFVARDLNGQTELNDLSEVTDIAVESSHQRAVVPRRNNEQPPLPLSQSQLPFPLSESISEILQSPFPASEALEAKIAACEVYSSSVPVAENDVAMKIIKRYGIFCSAFFCAGTCH